MFGKTIVGSAKWLLQGRLLGLGSLFLVLLALGSGCSNWKGGRSASAFSNLEIRPATGDTARLLHNAHYLTLMGRRDLALKELEEAYQQEPQNLKVADALARGYEGVGQWDRAQQIYLEALSRNEGNSVLQNNLCYSYYRAGKFQKAEACFREVLAKDPKNLAARNNLGLVLCRTGRQEEARRLWQEAEGAVAAEKKLKEVLVFLGTEGSPSYARLSPPAEAPAAKVDGPGSSATGKPQPLAAKPEAKGAPTVASIPSQARRQTGKPGKTSAPDRHQDQTGSPPVTKVATVKEAAAPAVNREKATSSEVPAKAQPAPARTKSAWLQAAAAKVPQERARPLTAPELIETSIRVENGNGVRHLARNTRSFLWEEGFNVVAIKNYLDFGVQDTVIYCRPEAVNVAQTLGEKFFHTANVQVSDKLAKGVDVRVILGHDLLLKENLLAGLAR